MSVIAWIKEHFEFLTAGIVGVFGAGGIINTQRDHGRRIKELEQTEEKKAEVYAKDMVELKTGMATLLERTKHL